MSGRDKEQFRRIAMAGFQEQAERAQRLHTSLDELSVQTGMTKTQLETLFQLVQNPNRVVIYGKTLAKCYFYVKRMEEIQRGKRIAKPEENRHDGRQTSGTEYDPSAYGPVPPIPRRRGGQSAKASSKSRSGSSSSSRRRPKK